jgi:hypothetical protein
MVTGFQNQNESSKTMPKTAATQMTRAFRDHKTLRATKKDFQERFISAEDVKYSAAKETLK